MFPAFVVLALAVVGGVVAFVVLTLRQDAGNARARDVRTEEWLADLDRRYEVQAAANERAAEAMIAARHRSDRHRGDRRHRSRAAS
jgi:hypothetical protein